VAQLFDRAVARFCVNERQHLHLVSDATGETIRSMARACLVQFDGVSPIEHLWTLIRTQGQMERVIQGIERSPGLVLFTIVNGELRDQLEAACRWQVASTTLLQQVLACAIQKVLTVPLWLTKLVA